MPKTDEINSTERLLGLIRNDEKGSDIPEVHAAQESRETARPRPARSWGLKKNITVGVDFGYSDVKLVKIRQSSERQWHILGYRSVPFDPKISMEDPEFSIFFRTTLTSFCGSTGKVALWSSMPSEGIEIRNILIPRVPKRQIANVVFWSLKKEVPFDENNSVFDFEILGEVEKEGVKAGRVNKRVAEELEGLEGFNVDLIGVQVEERGGWRWLHPEKSIQLAGEYGLGHVKLHGVEEVSVEAVWRLMWEAERRNVEAGDVVTEGFVAHCYSGELKMFKVKAFSVMRDDVSKTRLSRERVKLEVEKVLLSAARKTEGLLNDGEHQPFVLVKEVKPAYVVYELNAYLDNPKELIKVRSSLLREALTALRKAGVEITSPTPILMTSKREKSK